MRKRLHGSNDWMTPKWLYDQLNYEFNFDFDPCPLYADFDGLEIEWGTSNFCNPPYIASIKNKFIVKAYYEWKKGKTVVMLLPVSTSTRIFHDIIYKRAELRFLKGRLSFSGKQPDGSFSAVNNSMHDSMLVIFK